MLPEALKEPKLSSSCQLFDQYFVRQQNQGLTSSASAASISRGVPGGGGRELV